MIEKDELDSVRRRMITRLVNEFPDSAFFVVSPVDEEVAISR